MDFSKFTIATKEEILSQFNSSEAGLTLEEATQRLEKYGLNELQSQNIRWWQILFRQLKSPFIYLLLVASSIAFILERQIVDSGMILAFVGINTILGFYQEFKSEQTLKLLKQYIFPKARVRRKGLENIIKTQNVVPGDIVLLEPGDIVPADIRLIETNGLLIDESILTGESAPAGKTKKELEHQTSEVYEAKNICFSGTTVVSGMATGICFATGQETNLGEIANLTTETSHESNFELEIARFSSFILKTIVVTILAVFLINTALKLGRVNPVRLAIFSIALAVSVIPEALPVVTIFALARGALKLAKNKVIVKRLSAIEDLGEIEILCTDKTGTLTENRLSIEDVKSKNREKTLLYATLCSSFLAKNKKPTDAFEIALWNSLTQSQKDECRNVQIIEQVPFDPERKRVTTLLKKGSENWLIVRGAHEPILSQCKNLKSEKELTAWISKKGIDGNRAIAVAIKKINSIKDKNIESLEKDLQFQGLIAFEDPIKPSTLTAVNEAKKLGIRIVILTGDSREVAGTVAHKIGLANSISDVVTGNEFEILSTEKQIEVLQKFNVFARMSPSQKYKLVSALQKTNENVGFLGEGINDAPALKIANVGLVVHGASDIAREASDIVLLNKSLNTIVDGIREGREVFVNITKYITATLSSNFGNFYAIAISSFLIDFLPMLPLQILLVNLLSDFPMISIATDNVDPTELAQPRKYDIKSIALISIMLGLVSTCFDFLFFGIFSKISPSVLQTNWFIGSILTELVFLFSIRTKGIFFKAKRPSAPILILTATAFMVTVALPYTQFGQAVFEFTKPTKSYLLITLGIVACYFVATEAAKLIYYRFLERK